MTEKTNKIKIGIIGLGMVGEPLRKWFEEINGCKRGRDLFCYDIAPQKGYFDDVNRADVIFVAVPTPSNLDGSCNLSFVKNAVGKIKNGKIVVIKSTVAPGTVEELQKKYPQKRFIFNPEFLTETQAWEEDQAQDGDRPGQHPADAGNGLLEAGRKRRDLLGLGLVLRRVQIQ